MRSALAVTLRVLRQFRHDPRTIFMMVIAPILALLILNVIFGSPDYEPLVLVTGQAPPGFEQALRDAGARAEPTERDDGIARLEASSADALVVAEGDGYTVWLEGSDPTRGTLALQAIGRALRETAELPSPGAMTLPNGITIEIPTALIERLRTAAPEPEVRYVHGSADVGAFDYFGPVFIGVFVFFFVFITSGISFVRERTGGTLERMMATPIRRWHVVTGYMLGFGAFALVQTAIVAWASIYWVGFPNFGEFWLVLLVAVSMAAVSLTLGILVSEFANTELQVIQLMQIIVIPQILLSGMFDLSRTPSWMQALSRLFPLTYGADAMRAVMLRGADIGGVATDLGVLWGFVAALFVANLLALKKYRRI